MRVNWSALIRVWHKDEFDLKGPTLSSLLGMVSWNCCPCCEVKVNEISAFRVGIWLQAIP